MSTISARATSKRARLDEEPVQEGRDGEDVGSVPRDNTPAETETRRDEEFWFDDGTVILVARDVEFRVYSGILGNKSPVFRELFSQPRPTRLVSIHSLPEIPCSVVTLTDDPDDLRHILRIYMAHTVTGGSLYDAKSPSFDAISASIRLGHKYQMTELHDQSLAYLKYHFTDDFDVWEHHPEWCPSGWRSEEAIGVVNLARLIGEPYLLPTALLENLSIRDLTLCVRARISLRQAAVLALFRTLEPVVSPACKTVEKDSRTRVGASGNLNIHE
ncbi:hypothetical protein C8T65DRAFT_749390 [Cerioporus squamosus]|nr:hypothetical protein C8T65DRAFT_749390 [Cerioporus squamosus]